MLFVCELKADVVLPGLLECPYVHPKLDVTHIMSMHIVYNLSICTCRQWLHKAIVGLTVSCCVCTSIGCSNSPISWPHRYVAAVQRLLPKNAVPSMH